MAESEFIDWYCYDEMVAIMNETRALDKHGKMPEDVVIAMTIEHQDKHDWVGHVDPGIKKRNLNQ